MSDGLPFGEPIDLDAIDRSDEPDDRYIQGLKDSRPITITGRWVPANCEVCAMCSEIFHVGPEGIPVLSHKDGQTIGIVCARCLLTLE